MDITKPSEYERPQLFVKRIEEKAYWHGNDTVLRYPDADWELNGYRTLTWKQYAKSIDKVAFWLDEKLGKSQRNDTVAYFGPADARYAIIEPAVVKTNRKLFLPDGRFTKEGLAKLLEETECKAWIHPEGDDSFLREYDINLDTYALPSLEWCIDSNDYKPYPCEKTFEEAKHEVAHIIHTSGTTGDPRPIYHTNAFLSYSGSSYHALSRIHFPRGVMPDAYVHKSILSPNPPQWLGGIYHYIFHPVFFHTVAVLHPPNITGLSPSLFKRLLQMNVVEGLLCPPHTIHELYKDPESRDLLKSLYSICYLGAALDRAVGDDLSHHTRLVSIIGSTESGPQIDLLPLSRKLWYTHAYVPENGHRMVLITGSGQKADGSDDLYELVLERPKDGSENVIQTAFWNPQFEGVGVVETKELYAPVRDLDGETRWVFSARKDDLTKLNWLAKFHAQDIEARVKAHPDVAEVFVGGEGRPTPYVLVQARYGVLNEKDTEEFLGELYEEIVMKNNAGNVQEIHIPREMLLVAKSEKPFKKSSKMTLMRREIEKDYTEEIEEAYGRLGKTNGVH